MFYFGDCDILKLHILISCSINYFVVLEKTINFALDLMKP